VLKKLLHKIRPFFCELIKLPNIGIIFFIIFIVYMWGFYFWKEAELGSLSWWLDELGHAIGGFFFTIVLLYLIRTYFAGGFFRIGGKKTLRFLVISVMVTLAFIWEVLEFLWDQWGHPSFPWIAKAQEGQVDTMVDWMITVGFSFMAMFVDWFYERRSRRLHPDVYEDEEIKEVCDSIHNLSESILKEQRSLRKKKIRETFRPLKTRIDRFYSEHCDEKDLEHRG